MSGRRKPLVLVRASKADGSESRLVEGMWSETIRRIVWAKGGNGTVEECAELARRMIAGEHAETAYFIYRVEKS